jgi:hypothetical protein
MFPIDRSQFATSIYSCFKRFNVSMAIYFYKVTYLIKEQEGSSGDGALVTFEMQALSACECATKLARCSKLAHKLVRESACNQLLSSLKKGKKGRVESLKSDLEHYSKHCSILASACFRDRLLRGRVVLSIRPIGPSVKVQVD